MSFLHQRRQLYGRLAWLDELRLIAILLMVIDHALLFLSPSGVWPGVIRLTLTRCAEPLFVFVLAYLTIYLKRSMKVSRWVQIVVASMITSTVLSLFLGYAVADILASIGIVAPFLPFIFSLRRPICLVLLHVSAVMAALPISIGGLALDYSPFLILHQVILTQIHSDRGLGSAATHGLVSLVLLVISSSLVSLFATPSASVFVVLFGHPIAGIVICLIQRKNTYWSTFFTRFAKRPLTLYVVHLLGLAAVAGFVGS